MSSFHDLGTVRIYDAGEGLDVFSPRFDVKTRETLRSLKAFFDPTRKSWRVMPRYTRTTKDAVIEKISASLAADAPEAWPEKAAEFRKIRATTRRFLLSIAVGGMRIELPRGHRHEWTLNTMAKEKAIEKDGVSWLVPARECQSNRMMTIIRDIVEDDKKALEQAVGYLDGFVMKGPLVLSDDEISDFGLDLGDGAIIFAEPSFVRAADQSIPNEPIDGYPMRMSEFKRTEDACTIRLAFVCGVDAWKLVRRRQAGMPDASFKPLGARQCGPGWSRRRA